MNFKDFWTNLFKPKTNNDNNNNLVNIGSLIRIPKREDFLNDLEMLNLFSKLKKDYIQIICQNRYITSLDLDCEVSNKLNKFVDIITNNILTEKEEIKQLTIKDKVEYLIKSRKLELYYEEIETFEKEVIARIIVLKEIYQAKRYILLKNKKAAIINEINNLTNILSIYMAKKMAINLEILSYIKKAMYLTKDIDETKEKQIIKRKVVQLKEMINLVFENYDYKDSYNLRDIARMEKDLEEWAYNHKDITDLLNKYDDYYDMKNRYYYNKNNKDILKKQRNIELLFLIYYKYGYHEELRNIIKSLYKLKFECLIDCNKINEVINLENAEEIEKETYLEIITQKVEAMVMGQNLTFNNLFNKDIAQAKEAILNILKGEKNYFDYEEILTNKYLLNVLIACDTLEGLANLFKNYMVRKEDYEYLDFYEEAFSWNEEVSLGAIAWLTYYQGKDNESILYNLVNKHYKKDDYILPEGLREIENTESSYFSNYYLTLKANLELIYGDMNGKNLIMPSTLRQICDIILKNIKLKGLFLNKGLNVMDSSCLDNQNLQTLTIPASLTITPNKVAPFINIQSKRIIFNNYQDSLTLNDINNLMDFLSLFIELNDDEGPTILRYHEKDSKEYKYLYVSFLLNTHSKHDFGVFVVDSSGSRLMGENFYCYDLWCEYNRYIIIDNYVKRDIIIYAERNYCLENKYNYSLKALEFIFLQDGKYCFTINTSDLADTAYLNINDFKTNAVLIMAQKLQELIKSKEKENSIKLVRKKNDNK